MPMLPQIMLLIFYEKENDLNLPYRVIEDVENEIQHLLRYPDDVVNAVLLPEEDDLETLIEELKEARTERKGSQ